jgi:hypothetical protein
MEFHDAKDERSRRQSPQVPIIHFYNRGTATSAGPTNHSVITGIIRKARSDCMNPDHSSTGPIDGGAPPKNMTSSFVLADEPGLLCSAAC